MLIKKKMISLLIAMVMVFVLVPFGAGNALAKGNGGGNTSVKDAQITMSSLTYNGQIQKPAITVKIGQVVLVEGTDYELEYKNASSINAGDYMVTIKGKGNYGGKTNEKYTINPKKITPAVTLSKKSFVYNGTAQKPTVKSVKDGTTALTASDYDVSYAAGCVDVGSYGVTVTMKGNYTGSKTVKFKIRPKGTSLKTLTKGTGLIKVNWAKQTALMSKTRITGYQIKLATNSKFTKNKKTVTVKGYSKASKKVTKLKSGKKYYVKIRTYKTINGVKYYSKWSKVKTIRVR